MVIEQIYTGCLAQGAYYIESNGEVAIIDPLREVQDYIERAEKSSFWYMSSCCQLWNIRASTLFCNLLGGSGFRFSKLFLWIKPNKRSGRLQILEIGMMSLITRCRCKC